MSNNLKILVGVIKAFKEYSIEDVAKSIGYSRPHLNTLMKTGDDDVEKLLINKYGKDIESFFEQVNSVMSEPEEQYGAVKIVDMDELLVRDTLQNKIMLREILRNQAKLLAAQENRAVSDVLDEINESLKAESSEEFDAL